MLSIRIVKDGTQEGNCSMHIGSDGVGLKSLSVLNNCHINITTEINFQTRIVSLKRIEMCITLFSVPIEWEDD